MATALLKGVLQALGLDHEFFVTIFQKVMLLVKIGSVNLKIFSIHEFKIYGYLNAVHAE
jgi:hypothetical protein